MNKILFMNDIIMTFQEYISWKKNIIYSVDGVLTSTNISYVNILNDYIYFRIHTDRKNKYLLSDNELSKVPQNILYTDLKFFTASHVLSNWMTYNIVNDVWYNDANRPYLK